MITATRIERLRARMREQGLTAVLVTKRENIYYLSGFYLSEFNAGDAALIITEDRQYLASDFRYEAQVAEEAPEWPLLLVERNLFDTAREWLATQGPITVGFEPAALTVAQYGLLHDGETGVPFTLKPAPELIEELRLVKEADELACMWEAVRITDATYAHLLPLVEPGVRERELALEAEWFMRRQGAEGVAFDIIIAAGEHSAQPHAHPGARPLSVGDLVVVDMGARYRHYCADMTRTFAVGEATAKAQEIYQVCLEAQLAGVSGIAPGMTGREADAIVRTVIEEAGYGSQFGHGTGHGVGLEIHEAPRVSRLSERVLPVGAVVTIEPGIYLPDFGGVRIEDLALLTPSGVEILTASPKPAMLPVYG